MPASLSFLKPLIFLALERGVEPTVLAILLLFPLLTLFIAASRYLVGIKALGVFTPAILTVVFLEAGILSGLMLFFLVLFAVSLGRFLTRGVHLHYLARVSLIIWLAILVVFGGIFFFKTPLSAVLILILVGENLLEVQISRGTKEAVSLITETLVLAILGWFLLSWKWLQKTVLTEPEIFLILTAVGNILLGRFTGLRLLEYKRFRRLLK
jgi:hypothetical protein